MTNSRHQLTELERQQFAPHGTMRIGLAVGSAISAVWTSLNDETGKPQGVTVDLGTALGEWLDLPLTFVHLKSSGNIIETADADVWDVAFTPVDAERKTKVDFSTDYYIGDSTYMVQGDSDIHSVADADREGIRVIGVENTATLRTARRTLAGASAEGVSSLNEALELFRQGKVDAVALGRESLLSLTDRFPEARILPDHFHATGTALAAPKNREAALATATRFIEAAKESGLLAKILTKHGLPLSNIAPAGSRS